MRKIFGGAAAVALAMSMLATTAFAAAPPKPNPHANPGAPGQNKLTCFDGTTDGGFGGTCSTKGAKGPATLSLTSNNPNGDYAGVYYPNSAPVGTPISSLTQLGYTYTASIAPQPGNLSLNVPLSGTGIAGTQYAFIDAFYCPGTGGTVDVIHDTNCSIWFQGVEYPNWAALKAAFPDATISDIPFVIAERTPSEPAATYTVSNVQLGQPTANGK